MNRCKQSGGTPAGALLAGGIHAYGVASPKPDPNDAANNEYHSQVLRALGIDEPSPGIRVTDDVANERKRADGYKAALSAIASILDAVESARLEDNADIDADELIAGIRKQLRNAWGL